MIPTRDIGNEDHATPAMRSAQFCRLSRGKLASVAIHDKQITRMPGRDDVRDRDELTKASRRTKLPESDSQQRAHQRLSRQQSEGVWDRIVDAGKKSLPTTARQVPLLAKGR